MPDDSNVYTTTFLLGICSYCQYVLSFNYCLFLFTNYSLNNIQSYSKPSSNSCNSHVWCSLLIYYSACACLYHLSDRIILCLQSKQKRLQACLHSTCTCMNSYPCLLCSLQSYAYAFYLPKLNRILPRLKSLEKNGLMGRAFEQSFVSERKVCWTPALYIDYSGLS